MSDIDDALQRILELRAAIGAVGQLGRETRGTVDDLGRMFQVDPPARRADRLEELLRGDLTAVERGRLLDLINEGETIA